MLKYIMHLTFTFSVFQPFSLPHARKCACTHARMHAMVSGYPAVWVPRLPPGSQKQDVCVRARVLEGAVPPCPDHT